MMHGRRRSASALATDPLAIVLLAVVAALVFTYPAGIQ